MIRLGRFFQWLLATLLAILLVLNLKMLVYSKVQVTIDSRAIPGVDESQLSCDQPVIVSIQDTAAVRTVNASFLQSAWKSLRPDQARVVGFRRADKGFLTIGLPSIKRVNCMTYVVQTLSSIIATTSATDKAHVVVLVFLADFDRKYNEEVVHSLTEKFVEHIQTGFIQIVQLDKQFYPELDHLKRNFNDKPERVTWRAKQVADFAFMFLYAQNISSYYVQIEDDVICANDFVRAIRDYIKHNSIRPWAVLEFSELGFIGKLFKSTDLGKLAKYMMTFYDEQPVDWLITYFRMSMAQKRVLLRKPTLFQHVGLKSSFDTTKDNKLKDRFFDSGLKNWKGDDPPAQVITNMATYEEWFPSLCYASGSGHFWAKDPKAGDWLYVVFEDPQVIERVVVATGDPKKGARDLLVNGTLEASETLIALDEKAQKVTCGSFKQLGVVQGGLLEVSNLQQDILKDVRTKCLRLTIGAGQKDWIILRQIAVFTVK